MRDIVAKGDNIPLGRQGENRCTRVTLPNIRDGAGTVALYHQRSGDAAPYPLEITEDGDSIYWDVSSVDTAVSGFGRAEMQWLGEHGEILKSRIYRTYVEKALTSPGQTPDPLEDYAAKIAKSAAAAKASEDAAAASATQAATAATGAETSASAAADLAASASDAAKDAAAALKALEDGVAAGDFKGDKGDTGADGKDAPQIDDTAISADNPWSSKHIVDMLCPPLEESGNPVVCYPMGGYPLGVTVNWEPTQEGTGDPSPENVRPIAGRTAVQVQRTEDALAIPMALPETVYGGSVNAATGEGRQEWQTLTVNAGSKISMVTGQPYFYTTLNALGGYPKPAPNTASNRMYSSLKYAANIANSPDNNTIALYENGIIRIYVLGIATRDDAAAWVEAHPVQIAYRMATPIPFTATGAQPVTALAGVNTLLTDADAVTVTGRADPIKRITDLEDALASVTTND